MARHLSLMFLSAAAALMSSCYSYTSVPLESAPSGEEVRVRISSTRAEELQEVLLREDRVLEGTVVSADVGSLLLEVPAAVVAAAGQVDRLNQRVTLTGPEIVEVEVRHLNKLKTGAVAAAIVATGTYLAIQAFGGEGNEDDHGPGKGGTDKVLIPLLRWSW